MINNYTTASNLILSNLVPFRRLCKGPAALLLPGLVLSVFRILSYLFADTTTVERKQLSGPLWECVGEKKNFNGGKIWVFRYTRETASLHPHFRRMISDALYPALQPIDYSFNDESFPPYLKQLGFDVIKSKIIRDSVRDVEYIFVPDVEAVNGNWIENFEPHFKVKSSEGVLEPVEFLEACLEEGVEAVVSNGSEFLHDMFFHVIRRIMIIMHSNRTEFITINNEYKAKIRALLARIRAIKPEDAAEELKVKRLIWVLSVRVDVLWTSFTIGEFRIRLTMKQVIKNAFRMRELIPHQPPPAITHSEVEELCVYYREKIADLTKMEYMI